MYKSCWRSYEVLGKLATITSNKHNSIGRLSPVKFKALSFTGAHQYD